jgi:hypothetical protein
MYAESIPFVSLSEAEKFRLEHSLRERNRLLAHYHDLFKAASGLQKHKRCEFFKTVSGHNGSSLSIGGVDIPAEDVSKISEIKEIEWRLICGFSKLITKLAHKWHGATEDASIGMDDLEGEALQAAVYSAIHFTKEERYSTFLYHCVNRHMAKLCCRAGSLSGVSRGCAKTKRKFQKLIMEEGATFDSVVDKMGLSERQARRLQFSLTKVRTASDSPEDSREITAVDKQAVPSEKYETSLLESLIPTLELSDLEKAVLEGFMKSPTGRLGIGSVSKNLINPKTNKPYTRMSFTLAWQRVKKKIADAYGTLADRAA